ncbi:MAG: PorT family protein [Saprospiraceae bacterium]|nr:PorT family protein [Saprospiraceae bacterium]HRD80688.1 porin family protein [Saprospiraceae bacterium]
MMKKTLLIAAVLAGVQWLSAQSNFSGGFRAGLTFATLSGPVESTDSGAELEKMTLSSGFHVGATFNYKLTDNFGVRGELLYSQKGTNYDYDGESFWVFEPLIGTPVYSSGTRRVSLDVTNSYLETPLSVYARFGKIEISGGVNPGILIGSRGFGELTYSGRTVLGTTIAPFTMNLEHQYSKDAFRGTVGTNVENRVIEGRPVQIPLTAGAYYEGADSSEKLYKTFDLGLIGGLSFYLNKSLFLGGRVHYGLSDVTNTQQDYARRAIDNNRSLILREDNDRNLVLYLSLGFSL